MRDGEKRLARSMGLLDITMIGLGAMIGAGIFVLIGDAAGQAGPAITVAFLLNALIALIVGAAYAELGSAMPRAGGAYEWVRVGLSPVLGFGTGWISWFGHAVACSLYAKGFGSFTSALLITLVGSQEIPLEQGLLENLLAVGVVLLFLLINFMGSRETGLAENIVTSLKVFILLGLIAFGLSAMLGEPEPLAPFSPFLAGGYLGVGVAMGLTFIAFEGYEIIAQSGEEVEDPGRNLPRAIFISILVAAVLYVLVAFVLIGGLKPPGGEASYAYLGGLGELGIVEAAGQLMPYGRPVLLLAGMASTMSALNATVYSSSRVAFAMGRDGNLPEVFSRLHPRNRVPHVALGISGAVILAMALLLPIKDVAASADIMFLLLFVLVNYTVVSMRKTRPELERPFRMPFSPVLPGVGILAGVGLAVTLLDLSPVAWGSALVWFALGLALYLAYSRRRGRRGRLDDET